VQTKRIPLAILMSLELTGASCECPAVGPCLKVAGPEDHVCLSPVPDDDGKRDTPLEPCLEAPPADPDMPPCLSPMQPDPAVGPCLEIPPERYRKGDAPGPGKGAVGGGMARADVVERFADTLPADVLARLRKRDA
jgi:hypothetical protein